MKIVSVIRKYVRLNAGRRKKVKPPSYVPKYRKIVATPTEDPAIAAGLADYVKAVRERTRGLSEGHDLSDARTYAARQSEEELADKVAKGYYG